ncbi:ABC transporter ATP-binding protein [Aquabacterium sp.]|uniref:ABC transporter ATP-binding protein n=1 Tax=Aquabacterium sp. TaxID=1872578 RepID=UPI003D6CDBDE
MTTLHIKHLNFSHPGRHVFTDWSGTFSGGLTWLKGCNGSGKSTLLMLLAGGLQPGAGSIRLGDTDQAQQALDYRRRVFWCGPGPLPFDHLTPREYWGFMRHLYPTLDTRALQMHATAFSLNAHLDVPLRSLSSGTQRKVWVAASLAAGTEATLIDEPFNALDARSLAHLREVLAKAAQDTDRIWIVTSHEDLGRAGAGAQVHDLDKLFKVAPGLQPPPRA